MNLYLVKRSDHVDFDEYAGMVVAAESEEAARHLHPAAIDSSDLYPGKKHAETSMNEYFLDPDAGQWGWVALDKVSTLAVTLLGHAVHTEATVVLTDYKGC